VRNIVSVIACPVFVLACQALTCGQEDEAEAIRNAIEQHYFRGLEEQDFSLIEGLFHPDAVLIYVRDGRMSVITLDRWRSSMNPERVGDVQWVMRVESVDVSRTVASARIVLERPGVRYTDFLNLVYADGRWMVVNKVFHAQRLE